MKGAVGGGGPEPVTAPEPIAPPEASAATAPAPGAQPAAPTDVTGGGPVVTGGGATAYVAPEPSGCGQWVPAPNAVTQAPAPAPTTGPAAPPEPIGAPVEPAPLPVGPAGDPNAPVSGPASSLSTWPQWKVHFSNLGLSAEKVEKLGAASLTNQQLAGMYEDIKSGANQGNGAWSPAWEQRFNALGLPKAFVAEVKAEAERTGATDEKLAAVYKQTAEKLGPQGTKGTSAWSPAWEQRFNGLGLPKAFVAEVKAEAERTGATEEKLASVYKQTAEKLGAQGTQSTQAPGKGNPAATGQQGPVEGKPGWNQDFEAAFTQLGMPKEVIKLYAESGAPAGGLEAAFKHASGRVKDFTDRGWMQKFVDAKVPPIEMWTAILGDQPIKDKDADKVIEGAKKSNLTMKQRGLKLGISLFPGGRLAQYAFGKEAISGEKINQKSPTEIGLAALSGVALLASFRHGKNIGAAIKLRNGGLEALTKVGLSTRGEAITNAAKGATQAWGFKQKLMAFIPGTQVSRDVLGLGRAELAAKAYSGGSAAKLDAVQQATITQMFDDVKTKGSSAFSFSKKLKNLKFGDGRSQIAGMLESGGTKLGADPTWLTSSPEIAQGVRDLETHQQASLGTVMAGKAVESLGIGSNDGRTAVKYLKGLTNGSKQEWYAKLAAGAAADSGAMSDELLESLLEHKMLTHLFEEGAANIATVSETPLISEVRAAMDESRGLLEGVRKGGALDGAARASTDRFEEALFKLHEADPELATKLFPTYFDESAFIGMRDEALATIHTEHAAEAAAKAAETVAPVATATKTPIPAPDVPTGPTTSVPAPTTSRVVSGDGGGIGSTWKPENAGDPKYTTTDPFKVPGSPATTRPAAPVTEPAVAPAPVAPVATPDPVKLHADADGHTRTASGLFVQDGFQPGVLSTGVSDPETIARLAQAMAGMRG